MAQNSCREVFSMFKVNKTKGKEMIGKVKIIFTNQGSENERIDYQENIQEADKKIKEFLGWTYIER